MEATAALRELNGNTSSASRPAFMTHERLSRLLIGLGILAGLAIGYWVTPWGYLGLVGLAVNLIQFAFTGRCKVKDLLDRMGVPYEPSSRQNRNTEMLPS